jgi:hypothetical protein
MRSGELARFAGKGASRATEIVNLPTMEARPRR